MKKYFILLAFFLTACGSGPTPQGTPTPTPNPAEIALQMFQQQMGAEATQQIVGLHFTATAQVVAATVTQQAVETQAAITQQARIDAEATSAQERRDAQATQQRIDAESTQAQARIDAQSTADQARLDLQATQTAEQIARDFSMTQAVMPTHNMWTQQAVEQNIAIGTNEVELSNLKVKQQQQTNTLQWVFKYGAIIVLLGMAVYLSHVYFKVREIKDKDGGTRVIIFDNNKALLPDIMGKPVMMLETGEMPDVIDPKEQSEIVKRKQAIEALEAMPVNPTSAGVSAYDRMFNAPVEKKIPTIEVLPAGQISQTILEDIEGQIVEEG